MKSRAGVIIIGTGRSGTSLIMQALDKLGVTLGEDLVPTMRNNPVGTGESTAVRDRMVALNRALGRVNGFRPYGWQDQLATVETRDWICEYLDAEAQRAGPAGFAIKFPLTSIFLPVWMTAAIRAGVTLRFIWATRGANETIKSLMKAYGFSQDIAFLRYGQRSYYILRDAPDDTVMLPYEGWLSDPSAQVAILADTVGVRDPTLRGNAASAPVPSLNHAARGENPNLPDAIVALDRMVSRKRGQLAEMIDRRSSGYFGAMAELSDMMTELQGKPSYGRSGEEQEMRLRMLSQISTSPNEETARMNEQVEILTRRVQELSAENRRLMGKLGSEGSASTEHSGASGAGTETLVEGGTPGSEVASLSAQVVELVSALRNSEDAYRRARKDRAESAERASEGSKKLAMLKTELSEVKFARKAAEEERERLEKQLEERGRELERMRVEANFKREAYARLAALRDRQEEEIDARFRYRINDLEARESKLRASAKKRTARSGKASKGSNEIEPFQDRRDRNARRLAREVEALRNSYSFQLGQAVADAIMSPGVATFKLPYRFSAILFKAFRHRHELYNKNGE